MLTVRKLSSQENELIPAIAHLLAQAFESDTWANYLVPNDTPKQVEVIGRLFEPSVRAGLLRGRVLITEPALQGGLVAIGPGQWELAEDAECKVDSNRLRSTVGDHIYERFVRYSAGMADLHRKDLPQSHWYLELLGVSAGQRGTGIGAALVKEFLAEVDKEGSPTYLETSERNNVPFYQRLGFRTLRHGAAPVGKIPYWTLIREAKRPV